MNLRAFHSRHVVTPDGVRPATLLVEGEVIRDVVDAEQVPPQAETHDFGDATILPGLVDSHVHINDPGRTEWEGFETATRAAAAGGYTLLVDMPLNCVPSTTTVKALELKRGAAEGRWRLDGLAWGGVVADKQGDIASLAPAGVTGFGYFPIHLGVDSVANVSAPPV